MPWSTGSRPASLLPAPGSADVVTDAAGKTPRARAFQAGPVPPVTARNWINSEKLAKTICHAV